MGLFGNSDSHIINEIHRHVGEINRNVRELESIINNGVHSNNLGTINRLTVNMVGHYKQLDQLACALSQKEFDRLTLCWVDGRYLPLRMWDMSYRMVLARFYKIVEDAGF